MKLALKKGVELTARHFDPEFAPVFPAILDKWPPTEDGCVWITEAYADRAGFHGCYRAIDVRTHNAVGWGDHPKVRAKRLGELAQKCRARLGKHWDVVAHEELAGKPEEHIHFERDDKGD